MLRISVPFFYNLGASLQSLRSVVAGSPLLESWPVLYKAQTELGGLFGTDWFMSALRTTNMPGQRLVGAISAITQQTDFQQPLDFIELQNVLSALDEFETVLRNELASADTYFVTRKAAYDTTALIFTAEAMLPNDLPLKVPAAVPDLREAGKCLAFELCTASGFHILRATEAVLRQYWTAVTTGLPHPRQRNLGIYLKRLEDGKHGSAKVRAALTQIKDLHRNPLMHPEETLNLSQAVSLFGICQSAIAAMLEEIGIPTATALTRP